MGGTDLREQRGRLLVEAHEGFGAFAVVNGQRLPAELGPDPRGKRFRNRLLGGPARGEMLVGMSHPEAVGPLLGGEHPVKKTVTVPLDHITDALHIDQIAAEADQNAAGGKGEIHRRGRSEVAGSEQRGASRIPAGRPFFGMVAIRYPVLAAPSTVHPRLHLAHGFLDAGKERAADDAMPDI